MDSKFHCVKTILVVGMLDFHASLDIVFSAWLAYLVMWLLCGCVLLAVGVVAE